METVVEADGSVQFVEVLDAKAWRVGEDSLRDQDADAKRAALAFMKPAMQLLKGSEFVPGERRGVAVPTLICTDITFKLLDLGR
jgi:hypothetical protein